MDLRGLILILLGVALLVCVRDAASVAREIQPKLFRFNYPRTSRWLPKLPDYLGAFSSYSAIALETVLGVGAIVGGAMLLF